MLTNLAGNSLVPSQAAVEALARKSAMTTPIMIPEVLGLSLSTTTLPPLVRAMLELVRLVPLSAARLSTRLTLARTQSLTST